VIFNLKRYHYHPVSLCFLKKLNPILFICVYLHEFFNYTLLKWFIPSFPIKLYPLFYHWVLKSKTKSVTVTNICFLLVQFDFPMNNDKTTKMQLWQINPFFLLKIKHSISVNKIFKDLMTLIFIKTQRCNIFGTFLIANILNSFISNEFVIWFWLLITETNDFLRKIIILESKLCICKFWKIK